MDSPRLAAASANLPPKNLFFAENGFLVCWYEALSCVADTIEHRLAAACRVLCDDMDERHAMVVCAVDSSTLAELLSDTIQVPEKTQQFVEDDVVEALNITSSLASHNCLARCTAAIQGTDQSPEERLVWLQNILRSLLDMLSTPA